MIISELIGSGLVEEPQIPVLNSLFDRGVATTATRFIPDADLTEVQLIWMAERLYGHVIRAPRHAVAGLCPGYNLGTVPGPRAKRARSWSGVADSRPGRTTRR